MVETTQVRIITGVPTLSHSFADIACLVFSDSETVTTLAVDPIGVPFPPKPTPRARAQNNGVVGIP